MEATLDSLAVLPVGGSPVSLARIKKHLDDVPIDGHTKLLLTSGDLEELAILAYQRIFQPSDDPFFPGTIVSADEQHRIYDELYEQLGARVRRRLHSNPTPQNDGADIPGLLKDLCQQNNASQPPDSKLPQPSLREQFESGTPPLPELPRVPEHIGTPSLQKAA